MRTLLVEEKIKTKYLLDLEAAIIKNHFYVENTGCLITLNDYLNLAPVKDELILFEAGVIYPAYYTIYQIERRKRYNINNCYVIDKHGAARSVELRRSNFKIIEKEVNEKDFIRWF
ncbi:hypothetical protein C1N87_31150 (plasmid) [Priestia aryabhattai]